MGNLLSMMQIIGLARQNPQQAVMTILNNGLQSGRINQQQYDLIMNQMQNGANQIIQQLMNTGMINQQQYESARQNAEMFKR